MRTAVFAPHPDDEVVGCGGSMLKLAEAGHAVTVIYVTSGEAGSLRLPGAALAAVRETEARACCAALGAAEPVFLRQPDGGVAPTPTLLCELTRLIRALQPERLYLPHRADNHADHRASAAAVLDAVGRAAGPWFPECGTVPWSVGTILAYEVWTPLQEVSYVEDVTAVVDAKLAALELHATQVADIDYVDAVKGLNRYRGAMTGKGRYCECFQVMRAGVV